MTRNMMKDTGNLDCACSHGRGATQHVVALIRVEFPEFVAENRFICGRERQRAASVINEIEVATPVCVPNESRIVTDEILETNEKIEARQELRAAASRLRCLSWSGLRKRGCRRGQHHHKHYDRAIHSGVSPDAPICLTRAASRVSSWSMRRFNSGSRLNRTDALRQS